MAFKRTRGRARALSVGAVLAVACASAGCETPQHVAKPPGIHFADRQLTEGFERLLARLSPEDRAELEDLMRKKDVLLHVIRGHLSEEDSRGGASSQFWTPFSKEHCHDHPEVEGVPRDQNWDLVYDEELAERWARKNRIANPVDVVLYHEIFGHILVVLSNLDLLDGIRKNEERKAALEEKSREIENRYRRYQPIPLPEVPRYLPEPTNP